MKMIVMAIGGLSNAMRGRRESGDSDSDSDNN